MSTTARSRVRRLAVSRVISITGGTAAFLALNFSIYQRTGSAAWLAASLFLTFGTEGFISPFAGAIGDRFDRRRVMIASDLLAAVFFFAMAMVRSPAVLLALAFCSAVAETPFLSASSAAIPNLVEDQRDLGWANGLVTMGRQSGILLGPIIGGVLLSWLGPGSVFAINAVSFLVSAAIVASIRGRFSADRQEGGEFRGIRAGFQVLMRDRILRTMAAAWVALVLALGMTMVADVPLVTLFHTGSWGYGVLISCWGAGSIAGSLLGRRMQAANEVAWFLVGCVGAAVPTVLIGVSPWFVLVLAAVAAAGVADAIGLVSQQGVMQRRTPDAVRSRVSGAFDAVVHIGLAVSFALGGVAVAGLGPRGVYITAGLVAGLGALLAVPALVESRRERGSVHAESLQPTPRTDPSAYLVD